MRPHLVLLLTASLACSGGGSGDPYDDGSPTGPPGNTPNTPNTPAPQTASVELTSTGDGYGSLAHAFTPDRVTVARGGTVSWGNGTGILHNVNFASASAPADIANFSSGNIERTFPTAGTFSYSCTNHSGMTGVVEVR